MQQSPQNNVKMGKNNIGMGAINQPEKQLAKNIKVNHNDWLVTALAFGWSWQCHRSRWRAQGDGSRGMPGHLEARGLPLHTWCITGSRTQGRRPNLIALASSTMRGCS